MFASKYFISALEIVYRQLEIFFQVTHILEYLLNEFQKYNCFTAGK